MSSSAISAQGTIIQIATGTGSAVVPTAIALGYPTILTKTAHGLSNGDVVAIAGFTGADAALFNGLSFVVTNKTSNTFALQVDTTGKTVTVSGSPTCTPTTYTAIANVKTFTGFDGTASEIDKTNLASTGKEFQLGIIDPGHITMEMDHDFGDAGQIALLAAQVVGSTKGFKVILPSGTTPTASFSALVKKVSTQGGVDQVVKSSVELRITGSVTWA